MRRFLLGSLLLLVSLPLPARVTGRVANADGEPIANADVRAYRVESSAETVRGAMSNAPPAVPIASVKTDEEGAFVLDVRDAPFVYVTAEKADRTDMALVAAAEDAGGMRLRNPTLRGRVAADSTPGKHAVVLTGALPTRSAPDGSRL